MWYSVHVVHLATAKSYVIHVRSDESHIFSTQHNIISERTVRKLTDEESEQKKVERQNIEQ